MTFLSSVCHDFDHKAPFKWSSKGRLSLLGTIAQLGENLNFNARQIKRLIFSLLRQHFSVGVTMKFSWGAIDWIDTQSLNNGNYMALDLTT